MFLLYLIPSLICRKMQGIYIFSITKLQKEIKYIQFKAYLNPNRCEIEMYKLSNKFYKPKCNKCVVAETSSKIYNPAKVSWSIVYWLNRSTLNWTVTLNNYHMLYLSTLRCTMKEINISNFGLLLKSVLTEICQVKILHYTIFF